MKLFFSRKDGGNESTVTGYWLIEWKSVFSIVLLKFGHGSRDAFHSHAFNSISWLLSGALVEYLLKPERPSGPWGVNIYYSRFPACLIPIITKRSTFHKVWSCGTSWALSFRGPWSKTWKEYSDTDGEVTLSEGRQKV